MELQPAFVLHTRPWRETSLLVELLTLDAGRVGLVARGVRRASSGRKGLLQPFLPLLVSYQGRGELKNLKALEAVAAPLPLTGSALFCGLYVNELLMRLLARDMPIEPLFARYRALLVALSGPEAAEPVLRRFELTLLADLGVLPRLEQDHCGQPIDARLYYALKPEQGFGIVAEHTRLAYSGALLLALADPQPLPPPFWAEAKRLSRALLKPLLGSKPLVSRSLFRPQRVDLRGEA